MKIHKINEITTKDTWSYSFVVSTGFSQEKPKRHLQHTKKNPLNINDFHEPIKTGLDQMCKQSERLLLL